MCDSIGRNWWNSQSVKKRTPGESNSLFAPHNLAKSIPLLEAALDPLNLHDHLHDRVADPSKEISKPL